MDNYEIVRVLIDRRKTTNGDIIMSMFPDAIKSNFIESSVDFKDYVEVHIGDHLMRVSVDWWYAMYNRGNENG